LPRNYEPQILSIWALDMQQTQMAESSCIGAILHVGHLRMPHVNILKPLPRYEHLVVGIHFPRTKL
jgi:hypothetical protein